MKSFKELRKQVFWVRMYMNLCLFCLTGYGLICGVIFVGRVLWLTLSGIPPTSVREFPEFFIGLHGVNLFGLAAAVITIGVCEWLDKKYIKEFKNCVLKGTELELGARRFERRMIQAEFEERKEDHGNLLFNYIERFQSVRDYSLFSDKELKFLDENLGETREEPERTREEVMADAINNAEEQDSVVGQAEDAARKRYKKLLEEGYSPEEAERRTERFKQTILDNFNNEDS
ncbi:hypothetical protein IH992_15975 [Candidatus Poribacteria bacterium]|nr:hypothetical protein [Candidatus Poribacteria bacterium]